MHKYIDLFYRDSKKQIVVKWLHILKASADDDPGIARLWNVTQDKLNTIIASIPIWYYMLAYINNKCSRFIWELKWSLHKHIIFWRYNIIIAIHIDSTKLLYIITVYSSFTETALGHFFIKETLSSNNYGNYC